MSISTVLNPVLRRSVSKTPDAAILAALARHPTNLNAVRKFLIVAATPDVASLASNDAAWLRLTRAANAYRKASSSGGVRRKIAQRFVSHSLRDFDSGFTKAAVEKARFMAAFVGAEILNDERGFDTWLGNREALAARLNLSLGGAGALIRNAVRLGVLREVNPPSAGRPGRYRLKGLPRGYEPSAIEVAAAASIDAGVPDELASWLLAAAHPAFHFDTEFNRKSWWALVEAAGGVTPRSRSAKAAVLTFDTPADLALRLDAVDAAEVREAERVEAAAARKAEVEAHRANVARAYTNLTEVLAWPPKLADLENWLERTRPILTQVPEDLAPHLDRAIQRGLKNRFPERATAAWAYLKEEAA